MTIHEMQEYKREKGYTNEMIAEMAGLPLGTVQKIFGGITKSPRQETIRALEKVFLKERDFFRDYPTLRAYGTIPAPDVLRDPSPAYKADPRQGHYTIDDYYALPPNRRVELIDGIFYDMASPSKAHQIILARLHLALAPCVDSHPGCELFLAPSDVCLDNDDYTMVQPDLYITCGQKQTDKRRHNGPPDFIIEILSPSNRAHDLYRKTNKYQLAGVREYWVVDPQRDKVIVYDFEHEEAPVTYTFKDRVPVLISSGKCSVDFAPIYERVKDYL